MNQEVLCFALIDRSRIDCGDIWCQCTDGIPDRRLGARPFMAQKGGREWCGRGFASRLHRLLWTGPGSAREQQPAGVTTARSRIL